MFENIYSTERSTNLKKNSVFVKTVEHILAALLVTTLTILTF